MGAPRLVGIFAHPDDEVFCAGGTLAKYAAAGAEVTVVSATRGEAGQIRDSTIATRWFRPGQPPKMRRRSRTIGRIAAAATRIYG